tara:strand:- start:13633 stop:14028 length:396 start_codon:yes stop_codon:yes gene_type:complete
MTKENEKILTVSFILAGAIAAVVVNSLFTAFAASFASVARVYSMDILRHGLPVGVGALTFVILQFNQKALTYADEVVSEIKKVVWPSHKDTAAMTVVVSIMLIVSGLVLGLFDFLSQEIVKIILDVFTGVF